MKIPQLNSRLSSLLIPPLVGVTHAQTFALEFDDNDWITEGIPIQDGEYQTRWQGNADNVVEDVNAIHSIQNFNGSNIDATLSIDATAAPLGFNLFNQGGRFSEYNIGTHNTSVDGGLRFRPNPSTEGAIGLGPSVVRITFSEDVKIYSFGLYGLQSPEFHVGLFRVLDSDGNAVSSLLNTGSESVALGAPLSATGNRQPDHRK